MYGSANNENDKSQPVYSGIDFSVLNTKIVVSTNYLITFVYLAPLPIVIFIYST